MIGAITGNAFGVAGRRAAGVLSKARADGFSGLFVNMQFFVGTGAQTVAVPPQANYCEVVCVGVSGTGSPAGGSNSRPSSGGGGAMARSRFSVKRGDTLSLSSVVAAATAVSVSYKNAVMCSADYGRAGLESGVAGSANGSGGKTSNCIYNVEARQGGDGTATGGGVQAPDKNGVGWFNNNAGANATGPGTGGSGRGTDQSGATDATSATISNNYVGGGGGGSYGQSGTSYGGGSAGLGAIYILFYQV